MRIFTTINLVNTIYGFHLLILTLSSTFQIFKLIFLILLLIPLHSGFNTVSQPPAVRTSKTVLYGDRKRIYICL